MALPPGRMTQRIRRKISRRSVLAGLLVVGLPLSYQLMKGSPRPPAAHPVSPPAVPPVIAPTHPRPIAIVLNSGSGSVSVIDMITSAVLREEPTLREPGHWALSPDCQRLLVADAAGNAIFFLDPATGRELSHQLFPDPYQLWFSPDGKHLTVTCLRLNHVDIYDGASLTLMRRLDAGAMPSHITYTPDSATVFVSMQDTGTLVAIDLASMTERWRSEIGKAPAGVLWHNDKILVCVMGSNHVAVVDPQTGDVLRRVETDRGAHNVFLTPDHSQLYVTNRVGGSVTVLDAISLEVQEQIAMPGGPDDLCFAPDGKVWIAMRFADEVAVFDPPTRQIGRIPVGRSPHGIYISTLLTDRPARSAMRLA